MQLILTVFKQWIESNIFLFQTNMHMHILSLSKIKIKAVLQNKAISTWKVIWFIQLIKEYLKPIRS